MSFRTAANTAYMLVHEDSEDLARLGLEILLELARGGCYLARLNMMHLHDSGGLLKTDLECAQAWADRAKELHEKLIDADDLYDAGVMCSTFGYRFRATYEDAFALWEKAASLGSGPALYAICDYTRDSQKGTSEWGQNLAKAAALGCVDAMIELAEQKNVRGTPNEEVWLRAASALGSLRAKEMLESIS